MLVATYKIVSCLCFVMGCIGTNDELGMISCIVHNVNINCERCEMFLLGFAGYVRNFVSSPFSN